MRFANRNHRVLITPGILRNKRGESMHSLEEALATLADCGCGIDCDCAGALRLPNRNPDDGTVTEYSYVVIIDDTLSVIREDQIDAYLAAIKAGEDISDYISIGGGTP